MSGNTRPLTRRQFYLSRLRNVALAYIFIDFYSTILTVDPYFVAGPSLGGQPLPGFLASVSPWIVTAGRNLIALGAVLSAIQYIFGLTYVLLYFLYRQAGSVAGELWQFPTDYGDFLPALLDGGLAGFWGSWWHQTFRAFYMAPVDHLVRKGRLRRGTPYARAAYLLSAFLQSGLLHSAGSYTTLPETRWWRPTVFFLLCGVGIAVQDVTRAALWHVGLLPRLPRWAGRTANLLFVVVWLQAVAPFIVDDFTSNGTFLHEALPVSLFRLAGLGRPGDGRIWRLERDQMPRFVAGGWDRWWETGLAV